MDNQISLTNLTITTNSTTSSLNSLDENNIFGDVASSSVVGSNDDILIQILLYLPVKSLLVFKIVSKEWLSLISSSYFIRKHHLRTCRSPISGLFLQVYHSFPTVRKPVSTEFIILDKTNINVERVSSKPLSTLRYLAKKNSIRCSCNGLLLCFIFNGSDCPYCICNPTTNCVKILPRSPFINTDGYVSHHYTKFRSVFRPLISPCCISFSLAFDPLNSSYYEVICMRRRRPELRDKPPILFHYQVAIYSSKSDSWRLCGDHFTPNLRDLVNSGMFVNSGVFWNGSLHWVSFTGPSFYLNINGIEVKRMLMPLVRDGVNRRKIDYFGECRGHLHLIEIYDKRRFDIFELELDYSGWTKKYHVNLDALALKVSNLFWEYESTHASEFYVSVLLVEEIENEPTKLILQLPDFILVSYNLKDLSFNIIPCLQPPHYRKHRFSVDYEWGDTHHFIDSLASV